MKPIKALLVTALLLGCISLLSPKSQAAAQGADIYYRFSPTAIYDNGQDTTTLEVYTTGGNIASVTIKPEYGETPVLQLFDDGTHGDKAAGDGVYTLGGITAAMFPDEVIFPNMYDENDQIDLAKIWLLIEVAYTGGAESDFIYGSSIQIVTDRVQFPAEQVGNGLFATEYAFFIVDPVGETYTGTFPNLTDYNGQAIAQKFYSVYPDEFDFLNFAVVRGDLGMKAHAGILQTAAKNIGLEDRNYHTEYGSQGRLLTMVYSGESGNLLNHELGHTWGAFIGVEQGISDGVHWTGNSDITGVMSEGYTTPDGGFYFFVPNGDGTFKALGWTDGLYAPLELYLMGMIPPDEVPDVHVLINPDVSNPERVAAEQVQTYTIEEIMAAAGGERLSPYPQAQTHFNVAFIVFSDTEFSQAEFAWYSYHARCYMLSKLCGVSNFYHATGGRGTVNTRLADWGIPNIQPPTATVPPTLPPQPTNTAIPLPTAQPEVAEEVPPQPTPNPRPVFNFPICGSVIVFPISFGIGWVKRRLSA